MPSNISKSSKTSLWPQISIVIPTLNSAVVLTNCLQSIRSQNYPQNKIEIIICDGGSSDSTLKIAKRFNCRIYKNPLRTAEAGKAVGIKKAAGKYIALIDSDNILPTNSWLKTMILPLETHPELIGSEPWEYTYRRQGGFIERYSALTGVNDPYALIAGNYDRRNFLRPGWNGYNLPLKDFKTFQTFILKRGFPVPTIGANGTVYRKDSIIKYFASDYLVDIDLIPQILESVGSVSFAKVKTGIIHTYCESSISKFIKKQNRRITDLYVYQNDRPESLIPSHRSGQILFFLYVILLIPMLFDTLKGLIKKPDLAWAFHPVACLITLYLYSFGTIKWKLGLLKPINRNLWHQ